MKEEVFQLVKFHGFLLFENENHSAIFCRHVKNGWFDFFCHEFHSQFAKLKWCQILSFYVAQQHHTQHQPATQWRRIKMKLKFSSRLYGVHVLEGAIGDVRYIAWRSAEEGKSETLSTVVAGCEKAHESAIKHSTWLFCVHNVNSLACCVVFPRLIIIIVALIAVAVEVVALLLRPWSLSKPTNLSLKWADERRGEVGVEE